MMIPAPGRETGRIQGKVHDLIQYSRVMDFIVVSVSLLRELESVLICEICGLFGREESYEFRIYYLFVCLCIE